MLFRLAVSFPLSTEGYTPALLVQRQKLSTFMELPAYRVVIMSYGVHECLRSHRGVDLTGKPRDLAFACYQYKVNVGDCQGHAYAVIEKFFGLLKSELLYLQEFQSTEQFVEYLDYYNNRRIKAKRKGLPPAIHGQQAHLAA